MRRVLLTAVFVLALAGCATVLDSDPSMSFVQEFPGLNADEAYGRSLAWIAFYFRSADALIQLRDDINHRVVGRGVADVQYGWFWHQTTRYLIMIEHKEERARITFDQMFVAERAGLFNEGAEIGFLRESEHVEHFRNDVARRVFRDWSEFVTSEDEW